MSDFYVTPEASVSRALHATLTDEDKMVSAANAKQQLSVDPAEDRVPEKDAVFESCSMKDIININMYRHLFDVDQQFVLGQLKRATLPRPDEPVLTPSSKPDLYGPVWIGATVVVCIAVASNIASYVFFSNNFDKQIEWHYDFHTVSLASTYVLLYLTVIPLAAYFGFRRLSTAKENEQEDAATFGETVPLIKTTSLTLVHAITLFGYSMIHFILLSLLLIMPYTIGHWVAIVVVTLLASTTTIFSLHRPLLTGHLTWASDDLDIEELPPSSLGHLKSMVSSRKLCLVSLAVVLANLSLAVLIRFSFFTFSQIVD